jgi:hypothetical protein
MTDLSNFDSPQAESPFERIRQIDTDDYEFWSGRDLMLVLEYTNWRNLSSVYQDIYSSFCLENPTQTDIIQTSKSVQIGSGAIREVEDWKLSSLALERVLSRIASHKPMAVRELRKRSDSRFRIEIDIGATLFDFCGAAGLPVASQVRLKNYLFDFCIDNRLLIEVDELHHRINPRNQKTDAIKTALAAEYGYKLFRISIPVDNLPRLCGTIVRMLNEA